MRDDFLATWKQVIIEDHVEQKYQQEGSVGSGLLGEGYQANYYIKDDQALTKAYKEELEHIK